MQLKSNRRKEHKAGEEIVRCKKISSQKQMAEASMTREAIFNFVTSEIMLEKTCSLRPKKGCNIRHFILSIHMQAFVHSVAR